MKLVYLACPYSADTLAEMKARTLIVTRKAAELMSTGYNVFSPITHSDAIADHLPEDLRKSHDFWLTRDFQILALCDEFHVLCLPGWKESYGVTRELDFAKRISLPVVYHGVKNGLSFKWS